MRFHISAHNQQLVFYILLPDNDVMKCGIKLLSASLPKKHFFNIVTLSYLNIFLLSVFFYMIDQNNLINPFATGNTLLYGLRF